ncbi:hypothetical protein NBC122_00456 [Chryseobacterium salivictor]|uniref:Uncharacterized protein n=1 Tax=Chryseobacterium salivictor TaxID=2547600 RepID=A0A4P6ZD11_9FLAO|nr:hypothetical protein NBC122_00456 [Chryseobacterium salivictor]
MKCSEEKRIVFFDLTVKLHFTIFSKGVNLSLEPKFLSKRPS